MTSAQLATLKTDIQGQGSLTAAVASADWPTVANFYNADSATLVWLPSVSIDTLKGAIDWTTTPVAGGNGGFQMLSAGARDAYSSLTQGSMVDATQVNIRNGFASIFPSNIALALQAVAQRLATRLELLFSSGGPPVVSSVFGYRISPDEVQKAMGK